MKHISSKDFGQDFNDYAYLSLGWSQVKTLKLAFDNSEDLDNLFADDLDYTPAETAYPYYLSTDNTAPGSDDPATSMATGTSIQLEGLQENTSYYLWMRTYIGNGQYSDWTASPLHFVTKDGSSLPVNIQQFTGTLENGVVTLRWQSGVETELGHYVLERSSDDKSFSPITTLSGKGSGGSYNYQIPQQDITAMYRLGWLMKDGDTHYYDHILSLSQNKIMAQGLAYPNPASNFVNIQLGTEGSLLIYDAAGKLVIRQQLSPGLHKIDIRQLSIGLYYATTGGRKIVFQKK